MISTDDISLAFGMVGTSGRTTTYGKVAEAAAKLEPPKDVPLKDPKNWKIAGKGLKRLDSPDKVTGKQVYGADLKLPGMLNAAIKECPVMGGKIKSFDAAADLHHLLHARHLLDLGLRLTKIRIPIFTPEPISSAIQLCAQGQVQAAMRAIDIDRRLQAGLRFPSRMARCIRANADLQQQL